MSPGLVPATSRRENIAPKKQQIIIPALHCLSLTVILSLNSFYPLSFAFPSLPFYTPLPVFLFTLQ
jgi:hypothetical protein